MGLPPDPESEEKWRNLPQNPPSKQALPPLTGGMLWMRSLRWLVVLLAIAVIVGLLLQSRAG